MSVLYQVTWLQGPNGSSLKPIAINDKGQILCTVVIGEPSFLSDDHEGVSFRINDALDGPSNKITDQTPFGSPGRHSVLLENDNSTIQDLGTFSPEALNNSGQVVGCLADVDLSDDTFVFASFAVCWNGSERIRLFEAPVFSKADSINDLSEIVGTFDEPVDTNECSYDAKRRKAFVWAEGNVSIVPPPRGYRVVTTSGMNSNGTIIAGIMPLHVRKGGTYTQIGIHDGNGWQFIQLPNRRSRQSANRLNNPGQVLCTTFSVVGQSVDARCYLWEAGALTSIPFWGKDLNDPGQVVGFTIAAELPDRRAMLWQNGEVYDLNNRIPSDSGWTLNRADGINSQGQIIGRGTFKGTIQAFLLSPIRH